MSTFSYGVPDNSNVGNLRPMHPSDGRIELLNLNNTKKVPLPLPWKGMTFHTVWAAANYPPVLIDGTFLTLKTQSTGDGTGYGSTTPFGTDLSVVTGATQYDFALDSTGVLYMVFTAGHESVADTANIPGSTGYSPGAFGSDSVTGLEGELRMWYPNTLFIEGNATGITNNTTPLAVVKGRLGIAASTMTAIGTAIFKDSNKTLVSVNTTTKRVIA